MTFDNNKLMFSVVIPLYNKANHIQRAIDSVLNQNVQNFELIVVNDGSTDGSEKVVEQYVDSRIILINQENGGESAARNRGIKEAQAPYIAFLDADDAWEADFLLTISELITEYPEAGAYATALKTLEVTGEYRSYTYTPLPSYPWKGIIENYFDCLSNGSYPLSSTTTCVRKEVLIKTGNFNRSLRIGPDIDMWIRVFLTTKIAFTTKICAIYYRDAENRSVDIKDFSKKELELIVYLHKYISEPKMTKEYLFFFKKFLSNKLNAITLRYINNNRKQEAMLVLFQHWGLLDFRQKLNVLLRLLLSKKLIDFARKYYA
ncbi:glycosyltransferase family 2 protein [Sulfurovum sp.]|uniref:glycosyltransferase family 2 protein n=1 Tax=Sulfurovum sp. TaxID=1969726 RepID=UPI0035698F0E